MSQTVRPASGLFAEPREVRVLGDLFANLWQIAYVTTDVDHGNVDTTAELGHWLEVCQLQAADIEFFSGLVEQSA
jgi:hypothetical protein